MHHPDYLRVDCFLGSALDVEALASGFELGLIGALESGPETDETLGRRLGLPVFGRDLLLDMLTASGVVERMDGTVALTADFRAALAYRDLLEARLAFIRLVASDILAHFTDLLTDPAAFMAQSRTFQLFRYDRCFEETPDNLAAAGRWVAYTTALTRYEAEVFLDRYDVGPHRRMLDIGGNSGEFALRACRRHSSLEATVFDLPVVVALGRQHVAGEAEAPRIRFVAGDMRRDPLPSGYDLLTFKSVLHDWPEPEARQIVERSARRLASGGSLVIFERGPLELTGAPMPYAMIANLVFAPFFRAASVYAGMLAELGFDVIKVERVDLEMPFMLVSARKPA